MIRNTTVLAGLVPTLLAISQPVVAGIFWLRHSVGGKSTTASVRCLGRPELVRNDDMSEPDPRQVPERPSNTQVPGPHTKDGQSLHPNRTPKSPLPELPEPLGKMTDARLAAWIKSLKGDHKLYCKLVQTYADAAKAAKDKPVAFNQALFRREL